MMGRLTRRNASSNPPVDGTRLTRVTRKKNLATPAAGPNLNPIGMQEFPNIRNCSVKLKQTNLNSFATAQSPFQTPLASIENAPITPKNINLRCSVRLKQTNLGDFTISTPKNISNRDTILYTSKQTDNCKKSSKNITSPDKNVPGSSHVVSSKHKTTTRCSVRLERLDFSHSVQSFKPVSSYPMVNPPPSPPTSPIIIPDSPKSHVPIYKSNSTKPVDLREDHSVFDYFSNSQEFPDDDADQNRQIIAKLKQQNKIQLVKKKVTKKTAQKKGTGRVQRKETVVLKKLKDNLMSVLKEKQKTTSSGIDTTFDHDRHSLHDLVHEICETSEVKILQTPRNDVAAKKNNPEKSFSRLDHSILSLHSRKPTQQSTPIQPNPLPLPKNTSFHLTTPTVATFVNRKRLTKPLHHSTPIRTIAAETTTSATMRSPWRIADESIPKIFHYATSSANQLPTFSSDLPMNTERQPRSTGSSNSSSSVQLPRDNVFTNVPPLPLNHDYTPSLTKSINPIDSHHLTISNEGEDTENTLNLSNIENIQPPSSFHSSASKSNRLVTKLILGERNTNAQRSPLKPLIISNVLLSPPRSMNYNQSPPQKSATMNRNGSSTVVSK